MPIYEYECSKCGHQTEIWQKITDPPLTRCEICKGKMRKLISQSTFHLKGTGWYVTDYASKGRTEKAAPAPKPESKSTESTNKTEKKATSTGGEKKPKAS
ncbi:MAG: zinc ribbon domain-containing protein [Deltaproteobacteria bacterium]|jgi:putative FmdB family regulatory protein